MSHRRDYLLHGDIGGTNARLQLRLIGGDGKPNKVCTCDRRYASSQFTGLEGLVRTFLGDAGLSLPADASLASGEPYEGDMVAACCIALCGPIADEQRSSGPVLPEQGPTGWGANVQRDVLERLGKVVKRAVLINDCVATGLGLTAVDAADITCLHTPPGGPTLPPMQGAPMAAVVVGTGLGAVFLTNVDAADGRSEYAAHPSEGGMTEFQALDEQQWALRSFLLARDGHATVEGVVSGPGLVNVHAFLLKEGGVTRDTDVQRDPADIASRGLAFSADAVKETCEAKLCSQAIDMWLAVLGAELRQSALRFMPSGGLFVAGGIPPKLQPRLSEKLPQHYLADKLMGELIGTVPLFLVDNDDLGLLGARVRAQRLLPSSA
jgi:glucokinase